MSFTHVGTVIWAEVRSSYAEPVSAPGDSPAAEASPETVASAPSALGSSPASTRSIMAAQLEGSTTT